MATLVGLIYLRRGYDQKSIRDRQGVIFFILIQQAFNGYDFYILLSFSFYFFSFYKNITNGILHVIL